MAQQHMAGWKPVAAFQGSSSWEAAVGSATLSSALEQGHIVFSVKLIA